MNNKFFIYLLISTGILILGFVGIANAAHGDCIPGDGTCEARGLICHASLHVCYFSGAVTCTNDNDCCSASDPSVCGAANGFFCNPSTRECYYSAPCVMGSNCFAPNQCNGDTCGPPPPPPDPVGACCIYTETYSIWWCTDSSTQSGCTEGGARHIFAGAGTSCGANAAICATVRPPAPPAPPPPPPPPAPPPSPPAAICDESGDGTTIGTAVNINFKKGLVPCGKETGKSWQYIIETTIPASSSPGPITNANVTIRKGLGGDCLITDTDLYCAQVVMLARTNPTYTRTTAAEGNPNPPPRFDCAVPFVNDPASPFGQIINRSVCKGHPIYHTPATTTSTRGYVFADDLAAATVAANNILSSMPAGPGAHSLKSVTEFGTTLKCRCELYHVFILILNIYHFIIWYIALPIATLLIVIGGALILLSGVNANWYNTGRHMIFWAIMSVLLILGAWLIINTVLLLLGNPIPAWKTFP